MILVSEIGDKTFLVAALMAMKHDRFVVFSAAFSALITMTILSAVLGHAVPTLIPKKVTNFLAAALFLVFGARMLKEGLAMSPDEGVGAEMAEVELELEEKETLARKAGRRRSSISPYALEMGLNRTHTRKSRSQSRFPTPPRSPSASPERSLSPRRGAFGAVFDGASNLFSLLLSPAWVQTFVMTFLGEWGDRSQIATIAMAAGQDYWWVTLGAVLGHACCTGVAVIGGRAIAGKVSLRVVTVGGSVAFLVSQSQDVVWEHLLVGPAFQHSDTNPSPGIRCHLPGGGPVGLGRRPPRIICTRAACDCCVTTYLPCHLGPCYSSNDCWPLGGIAACDIALLQVREQVHGQIGWEGASRNCMGGVKGKITAALLLYCMRRHRQKQKQAMGTRSGSWTVSETTGLYMAFLYEIIRTPNRVMKVYLIMLRSPKVLCNVSV